jgi:hypothetical protein
VTVGRIELFSYLVRQLDIGRAGSGEYRPPVLVPADKESPNAGRFLKATREVTFPPVSEDAAVIEAVQNAKLTV